MGCWQYLISKMPPRMVHTWRDQASTGSIKFADVNWKSQIAFSELDFEGAEGEGRSHDDLFDPSALIGESAPISERSSQ